MLTISNPHICMLVYATTDSKYCIISYYVLEFQHKVKLYRKDKHLRKTKCTDFVTKIAYVCLNMYTSHHMVSNHLEVH